MIDLKFSILINDTRIDHHHGCARVVEAIQYLANKHGFPIKYAFPSHSSVSGTDTYARALNECEVVLVNGEGTLHHDRPAGLELLDAAAQAKRAGKYVVLINAGWEKNSIQFGQYLSLFDMVVARDQASQREMSSFHSHCRLLPDLSLYLPAPSLLVHPVNCRVAFTDSVIRTVSLELAKAAKSSGGEMLSIQYPTGNSWTSNYSFIREVIGKQDLKNPLFFFKLASSRLTLLKNSEVQTSDWLRRLGSYSLLVSGRYHACTLAMLMGVPFVALQSNTAKIANLINDSGLDTRRLCEVSELTKLNATNWKYSEAEKYSLEEYIHRGRDQTDILFSEIQSNISK